MWERQVLRPQSQLTFVKADGESVPPSPELGIGSPKGSDFDKPKLEGSEQQIAAIAESLEPAVSEVTSTLPRRC